jgi:regulation of enolase protein 1 (concanavalin A-like superfamily)
MPDTSMRDLIVDGALNPRLRWHCEPQRWSIETAPTALRIRADPGTDFWQRTHYGFEADNGHFLFLDAVGDFVLTTKVTFRPQHQYDQAGLMVRLSPSCWLKTSVEFEPDGFNRLGAVVTNGQYSDWSTQPIDKNVQTVWFRVRAEANDFIVDSSVDGERWEQLRMACLHDRASANSVSCGLYACSPKAAGYEADFSFLHFEPGRLP